MLYQLTAGIMIYSEKAQERDDGIYMRGREACFVVSQPQRNGQMQLAFRRADKDAWHMDEIHIPWSAVVIKHSVGDPDILAKIHSEMAGIIVPGPNDRIN